MYPPNQQFIPYLPSGGMTPAQAPQMYIAAAPPRMAPQQALNVSPNMPMQAPPYLGGNVPPMQSINGPIQPPTPQGPIPASGYTPTLANLMANQGTNGSYAIGQALAGQNPQMMAQNMLISSLGQTIGGRSPTGSMISAAGQLMANAIGGK